MLNHITIGGRLVRNPEMRYTKGGLSVANFTLAVDRDFSGRDGAEKETDFIDVVAWRSEADFVNKYFSKGRMAIVSGRLQSRKWEDRDGKKRISWEVIADNVYFGDSKPKASEAEVSTTGFTDFEDVDGELPWDVNDELPL